MSLDVDNYIEFDKNKLLKNIKIKSLQWNKINKLIKTKKELLDKIKLIW